MTDVQIFNNPKFGQMRILGDSEGNPLFVAKDVCEALGYTWAGIANIKHIPEEWRGVKSVLTPSGTQEMHVLTEQGLYFFLGRSDKPAALPFQKWIAGDVLPSIRKRGYYAVPSAPAVTCCQDEVLFLVRELKAEKEKAKCALEAWVEDVHRLLSLLYVCNPVTLGKFSRLLLTCGIHAKREVLGMILCGEGLLVYRGRTPFPSNLALSKGYLEPGEPCRLTGRGQVYLLEKLWRYRGDPAWKEQTA
jgi:prophage antirepressor-like protein